jgi:adenylosuccinate synthase
MPYEVVNEKIKPIYATLKGWNVPLTNLSENQMPTELLNYVSFLEKELGVPITLISTGPDRSQTIHRVNKTL